MQFEYPLIPATLVKRYKRFLADVTLDDGTMVTAHCANPGSMIGLAEPGSRVYLSKSTNPKRKLTYSWELIEINMDGDTALVGIHTAHPNTLVEEAITAGYLPTLTGYDKLKREVKYGQNSRIDILLQSSDRPNCYVEVKNVHLMRKKGLVEFPDSVTARGTKHLQELSTMVETGHRSVMVYLIQHPLAQSFQLARDIDPTYGQAFDHARQCGVEIIAISCIITQQEIVAKHIMPINE